MGLRALDEHVAAALASLSARDPAAAVSHLEAARPIPAFPDHEGAQALLRTAARHLVPGRVLGASGRRAQPAGQGAQRALSATSSPHVGHVAIGRSLAPASRG